MTIRLIILFIATSFMAMICLGIVFADNSYYGEGFLFSFLATIVGLVAMGLTIHDYTETTLEGHSLKIVYFFGEVKILDLRELEEWQERSYFIRGTKKTHLILFFPSDQRILISNSDHVEEFEKLNEFLKSDPVTTLLDTSPDRVVTVSRTTVFSQEKVFKMLTDQNLLFRWWASAGAGLTIRQYDLTVGGRWSFDVHGFGGRGQCDFIFSKINSPHFMAWHDANNPTFKMQAIIQPRIRKVGQTKIFLKTIFPSVEQCQLVKAVTSKDMEYRLQRLEIALGRSI